jgi:hypothetical protein
LAKSTPGELSAK